MVTAEMISAAFAAAAKAAAQNVRGEEPSAAEAVRGPRSEGDQTGDRRPPPRVSPRAARDQLSNSNNNNQGDVSDVQDVISIPVAEGNPEESADVEPEIPAETTADKNLTPQLAAAMKDAREKLAAADPTAVTIPEMASEEASDPQQGLANKDVVETPADNGQAASEEASAEQAVAKQVTTTPSPAPAEPSHQQQPSADAPPGTAYLHKQPVTDRPAHSRAPAKDKLTGPDEEKKQQAHAAKHSEADVTDLQAASSGITAEASTEAAAKAAQNHGPSSLLWKFVVKTNDPLAATQALERLRANMAKRKQSSSLGGNEPPKKPTAAAPDNKERLSQQDQPRQELKDNSNKQAITPADPLQEKDSDGQSDKDRRQDKPEDPQRKADHLEIKPDKTPKPNPAAEQKRTPPAPRKEPFVFVVQPPDGGDKSRGNQTDADGDQQLTGRSPLDRAKAATATHKWQPVLSDAKEPPWQAPGSRSAISSTFSSSTTSSNKAAATAAS
eukprot:gene3355-3631_t